MAINGYFEGLSPFVDLLLEEGTEPVKVLVDTGFSEELMLQEDSIRRLGLPEIGQGFFITAGGDEVNTTVHVGSLKWFGETRKVTVLATEGKTALLGMRLLFARSLRVKASDGVLRIE